MNKKEFALKYEGILSRIYRFFGRNRTKIAKGNTFHFNHAFAKGCKFVIRGENNIVDIESGLTRLTNTSIFISGSNNHILVMGGGKSCQCPFAY